MVNLGAVVDVVVKPCEKTLAQSAAPDTAERRRAVVRLEETEGKATGLQHGPEETRHTTSPCKEAPDTTPTNRRNVVELEETDRRPHIAHPHPGTPIALLASQNPQYETIEIKRRTKHAKSTRIHRKVAKTNAWSLF